MKKYILLGLLLAPGLTSATTITYQNSVSDQGSFTSTSYIPTTIASALSTLVGGSSLPSSVASALSSSGSESHASSIVEALAKNHVSIDGRCPPKPSPVPIPAALPLMLGGLGLFGGVGWKNRKKKLFAYRLSTHPLHHL